ncbi:MAG: hypothetical protein IT518_08150 [Burkholderiales bacterium]|nr:hypothetical protein [Burkholderiales bacterium]
MKPIGSRADFSPRRRPGGLVPALLGSLVLALAACGALRPYGVERILEGGDCDPVPDIEQLAITLSDHGTLVAFKWQKTRFAGAVLTQRSGQQRDASAGSNQPGEWEKRFPQVSATDTIAGSFLGFPAAVNASAGMLGAAVYDTRYPSPGTPGKGIAVVDQNARTTQLVGATRRVAGIAWAPKGEYFAVVELAPSSQMKGWRDLFAWGAPPAAAAQYDVFASVYHAGGLLACNKKLAGGVPSPNPNVIWD